MITIMAVSSIIVLNVITGSFSLLVVTAVYALAVVKDMLTNGPIALVRLCFLFRIDIL